MAILQFEGVGVKAVAACVPKNISYNKDLVYLIPKEEIEKTINSIGIKERRCAPPDVCASDLALRAAQQLIKDNAIDPLAIGGLIFVSQTPDYRQPATSMSLQYKLGLPKTAMCFDVNLACSGYVYGLSIAFSLVQSGIDNVLVLAGDTLSKAVSQNDKGTTPLFGDAASATLVGKDGSPHQAYFSLNSDGSAAEVLNIPYGGYRNPSCAEGLKESSDENGNRKNGEQLHMNGIEVFNFGLREAPKDIKLLMEFAEKTIDQIDTVCFHQANRMMTDLIARKLKAAPEKTPYSLEYFGNTSSASIPVTLVTQFTEQKNPKNTIVCGFGAGLSWATAILNLGNTKLSKLVEL